jgi:hypothetical protein
MTASPSSASGAWASSWRSTSWPPATSSPSGTAPPAGSRARRRGRAGGRLDRGGRDGRRPRGPRAVRAGCGAGGAAPGGGGCGPGSARRRQHDDRPGPTPASSLRPALRRGPLRRCPRRRVDRPSGRGDARCARGRQREGTTTTPSRCCTVWGAPERVRRVGEWAPAAHEALQQPRPRLHLAGIGEALRLGPGSAWTGRLCSTCWAAARSAGWSAPRGRCSTATTTPRRRSRSS